MEAREQSTFGRMAMEEVAKTTATAMGENLIKLDKKSLTVAIK